MSSNLFMRDLIESIHQLFAKKDTERDDLIRELRREIQRLNRRLQIAEHEIANLERGW